MMAMRTQVIDELIYQLVRSHSDVVLNLAAGLDTRPYRLELPCQFRWIKEDFNIIQYKNQTLAEDSPILTRTAPIGSVRRPSTTRLAAAGRSEKRDKEL